MAQYASIKELVIDSYVSEGGMPSYEKLTSLARRFFPHSRWKETHYAWYKSQIKTGKISMPGEATGTDASEVEGEIDADVEDSLEARVSLERDLRNYLVKHLCELEPGLKLHSAAGETGEVPTGLQPERSHVRAASLGSENVSAVGEANLRLSEPLDLHSAASRNQIVSV